MDVLIVDDNELNARALGRVLKSRCHAVRLATTSAVALAEIRTRLPDVILCDFELGEETSADFLRVVAVSYPGVRRILYSASRPELWRDLVDDRVVDGTLTKPASTDAILEAIDE